VQLEWIGFGVKVGLYLTIRRYSSDCLLNVLGRRCTRRLVQTARWVFDSRGFLTPQNSEISNSEFSQSSEMQLVFQNPRDVVVRLETATDVHALRHLRESGLDERDEPRNGGNIQPRHAP